MWDQLGFKKNPYSTKPLGPSENDVALLIGRSEETIEFSTALESSNGGIFIISGLPGVGKTSFLNIQLYQLERNKLPFGPKITAARQLCPIQPNDSPREIALRALNSLIRSIEIYATEYQQPIPKNIQTIIKWMSQRSLGSGVQYGISIFGIGGNFGTEKVLPHISEITFEAIVDIINSVVQEGLKEFETVGFVIVLDNLENLSEDFLRDTLMIFRDTLFVIENLYWILIGQSGLASLIQTLDNRIFQRLNSALELKPISGDDLKIAIDVRVKKFHKTGAGSSPISENIYQKLYTCSNGEIRFVFNYCSEICLKFVQNIRISLHKKFAKLNDISTWNDSIGEFMINNQITDAIAGGCLKEIVEKEFSQLNLKEKDKDILAKIGLIHQARPKDFKNFNINSMQDFSNYLNRFANQGLLLRRQEGRAILYELRGLSKLANEFGLLRY